jgi:rubrerythrin
MAITEIVTASAAMSFARKLEEDSSRYYQALAEKYPQGKDKFLLFAKENGKFITQFETAYYSVISDALEGCFAFNLNPQKYESKLELPGGAGYAEALAQAVTEESRMIQFYTEAAEQSRSLLADVPRVFSLIVKKREARKAELNSLLSGAKS